MNALKKRGSCMNKAIVANVGGGGKEKEGRTKGGWPEIFIEEEGCGMDMLCCASRLQSLGRYPAT